MEAHRKFVREGDLYKVCRKANKKRHFILFNDMLMYGAFTPAAGFLLHLVLILDKTHIEDVPDNERFSNAFSVSKQLFIPNKYTRLFQLASPL